MNQDRLLTFNQDEILGLIPGQAILDYDRAKEVLEKVAKAQLALNKQNLDDAVKKERERIFTWLIKLREASASDSAFWEHLSASIRNTRKLEGQRQSIKKGEK